MMDKSKLEEHLKTLMNCTTSSQTLDVLGDIQATIETMLQEIEQQQV